MSVDQRQSGLADFSPIVAADHSATAPARFQRLATDLRESLPGQIRDIQHIGGTAVPGLAGSSIIDVLLITSSLWEFDRCATALGRLGYLSRGDGGISSQRLFGLGSGTACQAMLYVCEPGARSAVHHLLLRDYLRNNEQERDHFSRLKQQLASQHLANAAAYSAGKRPRLTRLLEQATGRR